MLQWEFNGNNWPGAFANGTSSDTIYPDIDGVVGYGTGYRAGYNDTLGITQKWTNCADIKIVPDPDKPNQIYKPDPVPALPDMPPVYNCVGYVPNQLQIGDITKPEYINLTPDKYKYTGAGVLCLSIDKIHGYFVQCARCKVCLDPKQDCPSDCYCRW